MHYLYIIFSEKMMKFYIGETSDVENRLIQHNTHFFKTNFTKGAEDWIVKLKFPTKSKVEAILLERFIKKMKSKKFIERIISEPFILTEILEKQK
ncbi:MAG: GIY-YIG nuclease family protein [Gillisia sp.]